MRWIKFFKIIFVGVHSNPDPPDRSNIRMSRQSSPRFLNSASPCYVPSEIDDDGSNLGVL